MDTVTEDKISRLMTSFGKIVWKHTLNNRAFKRNLVNTMRRSKRASDTFREDNKRITSMASGLTKAFKAAALGVKGFVISIFTGSTIFQMAKELVTGLIESFLSIAFHKLTILWNRGGQFIRSLVTNAKTMFRGFIYRVGTFLGMENRDVDHAISKMRSAWDGLSRKFRVGWEQTWPLITGGIFGLLGTLGLKMAGVDAGKPWDVFKNKDWTFSGLMASLSEFWKTITSYDWGAAWDEFKAWFGFDGGQWALALPGLLFPVGTVIGKFLESGGKPFWNGLKRILTKDWGKYKPDIGANPKGYYIYAPLGWSYFNLPIWVDDSMTGDDSTFDDSWQ